MVVDLFEVLLDPFERTPATADVDNDPVTEAEIRDIEASREWFRNHDGIPLSKWSKNWG